ncbi:hypothetical protein [Bacillus sp. FJAT-29814]|nr:hypothetical protein [Bacillus sp. FJAT-29814]
MTKQNKPLLSDEFLNELAKEINEQYGWTVKEQNDEPKSFLSPDR